MFIIPFLSQVLHQVSYIDYLKHTKMGTLLDLFSQLLERLLIKLKKKFSILNKLTTNQYTINNSFSFADELSKFSNVDNLFMVYFDVESLFTNIPLQETIEICISEMFSNTNTVSGLCRVDFKKIIRNGCFKLLFYI